VAVIIGIRSVTVDIRSDECGGLKGL